MQAADTGVSIEHILQHLLETSIHQHAVTQEPAQSMRVATKELCMGPQVTAIPLPDSGHAAQRLLTKMMAEDNMEAFIKTFEQTEMCEGWPQWD